MGLCSMICASLNGRGIWERMYTCIRMAESLCFSPETTTTVLTGYTQCKMFLVIRIYIYIFDKKEKIIQWFELCRCWPFRMGTNHRTIGEACWLLMPFFDPVVAGSWGGSGSPREVTCFRILKALCETSEFWATMLPARLLYCLCTNLL